jgi:hypothetical protein
MESKCRDFGGKGRGAIGHEAQADRPQTPRGLGKA